MSPPLCFPSVRPQSLRWHAFPIVQRLGFYETICFEEFDQCNRLFRNRGQSEFTDVSEAAGLIEVEYSLGTTAADFDNDGFADIYVPNFGENQLYHNNGDGRFEDLSERAGLLKGPARQGLGVMSADLDEERLLIGIGNAKSADRLTVHWPSGREEHWNDLPANSTYHVMEGTGAH
jgi:hypothetical protein